jgi:translation initiation factor IF-1
MATPPSNQNRNRPNNSFRPKSGGGGGFRGKRSGGRGGRRTGDPSAGSRAAAVGEDEQQNTEAAIALDGVVTQVLAGTMFRVTLNGNGHQVLAHISGKMRKRFIKLVVGDNVRVEMSPYDTDKARIVYRM